MSVKKEIEKIVDKIPYEGGWFHNSNRESFINAAEHLHNKGVDLKTIEEVLDVLYGATSAEYGEWHINQRLRRVKWMDLVS